MIVTAGRGWRLEANVGGLVGVMARRLVLRRGDVSRFVTREQTRVEHDRTDDESHEQRSSHEPGQRRHSIYHTLTVAMDLKRSLILVHRWLGVALCLLFLLWFASGIGMMYWDFPGVTPADRLERSPALAPAAIVLSPAEAYAQARRFAVTREHAAQFV